MTFFLGMLVMACIAGCWIIGTAFHEQAQQKKRMVSRNGDVPEDHR